MTRLLTEVFKVPLCDNCVYQNIPSSIGRITLKLSKGQIKSVRKGTSTIRDAQQEEKTYFVVLHPLLGKDLPVRLWVIFPVRLLRFSLPWLN